ncbi:aminoacylase-1 [Rhincodon typus]|uniref:aminoacylase-1 n=1 Tax=Rhincodon typus TaxID=259920 RepID=UPI00202DF830|nr:aminoacylase-1 [Rhincodon typus]
MDGQQEEEPSVRLFREYLRIQTVHPQPDYDGAIKFLERMSVELDLPLKKIEVHPGRTVVVISWEGTDPKLKSVLLNSHTDVVPVFEEHWKHDPFAAVKDEQGNIYGRGTQDMKCVTIQYIEAIRRLKSEGKRFPRTIHLLFVPGESQRDRVSPGKGMQCTGAVQFPYQCRYGRKVLNSFLDFREKEKKRLDLSQCLTLGDVTTINLTLLQGGVAFNVVPEEMMASFDIRIPPTVDLEAFEEQIKTWCQAAGDGVAYEFHQKIMDQSVTSIDKSDPWWNAFSSTCQKL